MDTIEIGHRSISASEPVYIIAEAGVNHNGDVALAKELVSAAKDAGADCVKFQTFRAEQVATLSAPKAKYQLGTTNPEESQREMLQALELRAEDYRDLLAEAQRVGITLISTPYSMEDADFLEELGLPAFKIASGQIIELFFLRHVARKNLPIVLSTGMATMDEVSAAVEAIRSEGNNNIVVLQCTTNYPSAVADANIRAMEEMGASLGLLVGYSDHVPSNYASYAAVSRGARVIEKHFTLDTAMEGPDHSSSLDPIGFRELVQGIRSTESSLGDGVKKPCAIEVDNAKGIRRSVVAKQNIEVGEVITLQNLTCKRPTGGLPPNEIDVLLGKKAKRDIEQDEFVVPELVE